MAAHGAVLPGWQSGLLGWQLLQIQQRLQIQAVQRWAQRWQEAARPERLWAEGGWDLPLASLRWGLQESEQAWQDAWAAMCALQGDWRRDAAVGSPCMAAWQDSAWAPVWQAWAACLAGPQQGWSACMQAACRRQRAQGQGTTNVP